MKKLRKLYFSDHKYKGQAKCTPNFYYMHTKFLEWVNFHSKNIGVKSCPLQFFGLNSFPLTPIFFGVNSCPLQNFAVFGVDWCALQIFLEWTLGAFQNFGVDQSHTPEVTEKLECSRDALQFLKKKIKELIFFVLSPPHS